MLSRNKLISSESPHFVLTVRVEVFESAETIAKLVKLLRAF